VWDRSSCEKAHRDNFMGSISVGCHKPGPGREQELLELVRNHLPPLRAGGLVTDRASIVVWCADGTMAGSDRTFQYTRITMGVRISGTVEAQPSRPGSPTDHAEHHKNTTSLFSKKIREFVSQSSGPSSRPTFYPLYVFA
jgi:hypothetical protein